MNSIVKISLVLCFVFTSTVLLGQTQTYPGTWEYQNGDQRFIVKLWQEGNDIEGHYKMVKVDANGNQLAVIYSSRRTFGNGNVVPPVIYSTNGSKLAGPFHDNTIPGNPDNFKSARFEMTINQFLPGCTTCVVTASWKVTDTADLYVAPYYSFSVPVNVTLTKVSDSIVLD